MDRIDRAPFLIADMKKGKDTVQEEEEKGTDETAVLIDERDVRSLTYDELSIDQSRFFARHGYFLVPNVITESRCESILERLKKEKASTTSRRRLPKFLRQNREALNGSPDGHCAQLAKDLHRMVRREGIRRRRKRKPEID